MESNKFINKLKKTGLWVNIKNFIKHLIENRLY